MGPCTERVVRGGSSELRTVKGGLEGRAREAEADPAKQTGEHVPGPESRRSLRGAQRKCGTSFSPRGRKGQVEKDRVGQARNSECNLQGDGKPPKGLPLGIWGGVGI